MAPMNIQIIEQLTKKHGTPLMITDCDSIRSQYNALQNALPTVKIHYALKPFPHETVIRVLDEMGTNFDTATNGEIELIKRMGIDPSKCIHTHPIKTTSDITKAIRFGITNFVVDNEDEILKFVKFRKKVKLMIRVSFRSPSATIDLSKKFGCELKHVISLIEFARKHKLHVNALSFHVGSQSKTSDMYVHAIKECNNLIAEAILRGLPPIEILDIGGGFPISYEEQVVGIEEFCKPIREELSLLPDQIRVFAEPGRFIVGPSTINVMSVVGKAIREGKFWYYVDDGNYGSYTAQFFDHITIPMYSVKKSDNVFDSVITGPTCDSTDVIKESIQLPKLDIGDLIIGTTIGAYSWATSTNFNFCKKPKQIFLNR